ncbi:MULTISPECIES: GNAT family N-acetyltransferase [Vibrio]|uniref:GNAT family N-acetyltransferase n=1 Tax=Vibrio TaxID=662 RepID=UPI00142F2110|nr:MULTISPECIES: GNAT family N-acetyltransferase [Vibrio]
MAITVYQPEDNSLHLTELYSLFLNEWGEVDPFAHEKEGLSIPTPVLALDSQNLVGGIAFTRFAEPGTESLGVWINALLVKPQYRRQGISQRLIREAQQLVKREGVDTLYVYTHLPSLYEPLGWECVEQHDDHYVLSKHLN